jgi:hypothetical protein
MNTKYAIQCNKRTTHRRKMTKQMGSTCLDWATLPALTLPPFLLVKLNKIVARNYQNFFYLIWVFIKRFLSSATWAKVKLSEILVEIDIMVF